MRTLQVSLDAVIVSVASETPRILLVERDEGLGLPSGTLESDADETLTLALRRVVRDQTGVEVRYVEQLYTFGDLDRTPDEATRDLAVGYLALTADTEAPAWHDLYTLFPWEDRRSTTDDPYFLTDLEAWAGDDPDRTARWRLAFGVGTEWDPIRALERYELLYEAGIVSESGGRRGPGQPLVTDHRRIAATALGRLRGKLTYRPVVFDAMPETFTLTDLQGTVEAIVGIPLHKQNFRRVVEREQLVEPTGEQSTTTGGRPAELFRFRTDVAAERPRPGFPLPRPKKL